MQAKFNHCFETLDHQHAKVRGHKKVGQLPAEFNHRASKGSTYEYHMLAVVSMASVLYGTN